jgi:deoxyribose-phosphate aldolase
MAMNDAIRALRLLDLTDLADDANEAGLEALCARAMLPPGPVAAICIWPRFVRRARSLLGDGPVRLATVVNFPDGNTPIAPVLAETEAALADGADEIDLVMPWAAVITGHETGARAMIQLVKERCGERRLKVILETGEYRDLAQVETASRLAIESGADFIKTSTGKTARSATPEAVRTMLGVIAEADRPIGLKPSGGIRTLADAQRYLALADAIMGPDWASPQNFRFGASGLHQVLLDAAAGADNGEASGPY